MSKKPKFTVLPVPNTNIRRRVVLYNRPDFTEWGFVQTYPEDVRPFINKIATDAIETVFGVELQPNGVVVAGAEDDTCSTDFAFRIFNLDLSTKQVRETDPLDFKVSLSITSAYDPDIEIVFNLGDVIAKERDGDFFNVKEAKKRHLRLAKSLREQADLLEEFSRPDEDSPGGPTRE